MSQIYTKQYRAKIAMVRASGTHGKYKNSKKDIMGRTRWEKKGRNTSKKMNDAEHQKQIINRKERAKYRN